ncbi:PREDICTED: uncharacterized protein LOC109183018 [Ipomoea nil]|uniref:uncharacterized protein LOC109183018 n=1 Tax=Ipomoea nil TaxID=35883 RepID=UPI000900B29B|nr:PREDICTED: uncharacterized protein LOC109183018 [Ipomoea nil]
MSLKAQKGFLKALATRLKGNSSSSASYATAATDPHGHAKSGSSVLKGEFFPVYVAVGMIALSAGFGIHTARHQLSRSPNVYVKKSRRETVPEVEEPEQVVEDADNFINKSFFRKVAHVQDSDRQEVMSDPIRGDVFVRKPKAETLKSVGVE